MRAHRGLMLRSAHTAFCRRVDAAPTVVCAAAASIVQMRRSTQKRIDVLALDGLMMPAAPHAERTPRAHTVRGMRETHEVISMKASSAVELRRRIIKLARPLRRDPGPGTCEFQASDPGSTPGPGNQEIRAPEPASSKPRILAQPQAPETRRSGPPEARCASSWYMAEFCGPLIGRERARERS